MHSTVSSISSMVHSVCSIGRRISKQKPKNLTPAHSRLAPALPAADANGRKDSTTVPVMLITAANMRIVL
jgi:hypothetical protein